MPRVPHRACLHEALRLSGVTQEQQRQAEVEQILAAVEAGLCPRCQAGLRELPAASRVTPDRCVPVCSECGSHEAVRELCLAEPEMLASWPHDASEMRAELQAGHRRLAE